MDDLIARLEAATADDKRLIEAVWEHLCQTSLEFRRYACTTTDGDGWTQTGRFMRMLDAGAYESAALTLVPSGKGHDPWWMLKAPWRGRAVVEIWVDGKGKPFRCAAPTPSLAICIAALHARKATNG